MASVVAAIDGYTPKRVGENGSVQYGWSNDICERISQFFFQLVRVKSEKKMNSLERQLRYILTSFKGQEQEHLDKLAVVYKLIGQTRDIVAGKGEQQLAFMQIWVWYQFYPELAKAAFRRFVLLDDAESSHPYGSWKDIKYFCNYVRERSVAMQQEIYDRQGDKVIVGLAYGELHPLVEMAMQLALDQLRVDWDSYTAGKRGAGESKSVGPVSLLARWLPREPNYKKKRGTKFGWMYDQLAELTFPHFLESASTDSAYYRAKVKCRIQFKKRIVTLSKHLDTVQIKQCGGKWAEIKFNNVTSQTLRKQKLALLNKTKGNVQRSLEDDRVACARNFTDHMAAAKADPERHKMHGRRCSCYELVKDALIARSQEEQTTVNLQWEDNSKNNRGLGNFIPMCDTSSSMEMDNSIPLYNSIGLGIRISEKTHDAFKHRILTFDCIPQWVNLSGCDTFVEKVRHVKQAAWGTSTRFYKALKMILEACIESKVPPSEVKNMVLVVLSDMQVDMASDEDMSTMFENITQLYISAGLASKWNSPFSPPHILFWNLRKTEGCPSLSTQKNVTFLSGYNSVLMNVFCEKGIDALQEYTPRKMLQELLSHERYIGMEGFMLEYFAKR